MKSALIFSVTLKGHRQNYAQHFIEALLRRSFQVTLIVDRSEIEKTYTSILPYSNHPSVHVDKVSDAKGISFVNFRKLQDRFSADLTIFLHADSQISMLNQRLIPGSPHLRGKNLGIFIRSTNYIHIGRQALNLVNRVRLIKRLSSSWGSNPYIFHEFTLPKFSLLDVALIIDEGFAKTHNQIHRWVPDMVFPVLPDDPIQEQIECREWAPKLARFIDQNHGREVIFYFGASQMRRGYDTLLRLANDRDCCFIHCGLLQNDDQEYSGQFNEDIAQLRKSLSTRGLLFETNAYIRSYRAQKLFFDTCQYVILPYRKHLGSSGVMLQAVHFGRPVMVPAGGLMEQRTKQAGLGLTYRSGADFDFYSQWERLKSSSADFADNLINYSRKFSVEQAQFALDTILDEIIG